MKKKVIGIFCCIFIAFLFFFFSNEELKNTLVHPSGYKIHHEEINLNKDDILIYADSVMNNWFDKISPKQYQEIELLFHKEQWQKIDEIPYDENDASIKICMGYPEDYQNYQEFLIYADDKIKVFSENASYQMAAGTYKKLNAYIHQYNQKQHETVAKLDTFLPDFFAAEYDVYWRHDYGKVLYTQDNEWEISADNMFCSGSPKMSKDVLAVLSNQSEWEEIPFDTNLLAGSPSIYPIRFLCKNLYGDDHDYTIDFRKLENGKTHIAINTYAAFLVPGEIYDQIEKILNLYEDDWEVIPLSE